MSLEHIQAISRRLDRNEQRSTLVMFITGALVFFVVGQQWQRTDDVLTRAMWALYGLGIAGCFLSFHLMMRIRRDPAEPGGVFLRRRLERFLGLSQGKNYLGLLPMVPWFVAMIVMWFTRRGPTPHALRPTPEKLALNLAPVLLLAAVWLGAMIYLQPRAVRRLRRDLDELNASMK